MKLYNLFGAAALAVAFVGCKQEVITLQQQTTTTTPVTGTKGSADFTKFVSIGNSLTAGFQAGALFTEGQNNSLPLILSKQFSIAQGSTLAFNQPDINSVNGYNSSYSNPGGGIIRGRLVLFAADGIQAHALPTPAGSAGVPAPYNTADLPGAYTGDKSKLNNFGVPGIILAQCLTPATGGPAASNPAYNPYYSRFASNPSADGSTGSTILGDAIATQPTFFSFELGNNDVLGYAVSGGDGSIGLTTHSNFQTYYTAAIGSLMTNTAAKGVVTTIPNVTTIPFFYTIKWNAVPLDAATASSVTTNLANNYNAFLAGMKTNGIITDGELSKRTLTYSAGQNAILITDETLTDLSPYMQGPYAGLLPYAIARQTTSSDLVPLTAGGILGTVVNNNPQLINGVTIPLADKYILIPSETGAILSATADFNAIINAVVANYSTRIAVADINAAFTSFVTNQFVFADYITITPTFTPPTGAFSEDGVHPNSRGYAYMANILIDAINAKFGATVPHASLADYKGVGLPLTP